MQVHVKQNLWIDGASYGVGACVDLSDDQACDLCARGLVDLLDAFSQADPIPAPKADPIPEPVIEPAPRVPARKKKK